jgi:hypothetical protein
VRHARADALDQLEPLLVDLRTVPGLREKSRGTFYLRSRAFLHFHEDPAGLFADLRGASGDFDRYPVNTDDERQAVLTNARAAAS